MSSLSSSRRPGLASRYLTADGGRSACTCASTPSPLRDGLLQVVDDSVVLLALPTLLTGHRYDVVVGLAADDPALDRLRDERRELVRHGHAHAP